MLRNASWPAYRTYIGCFLHCVRGFIAFGIKTNLKLAYRIPYLKFYLLRIKLDGPGPKFDAYGHVMNMLESFVSKLQQKATFAHSSVSDDNVLE